MFIGRVIGQLLPLDYSMYPTNFKIICAGSAMIDSIGYSKDKINVGDDVPGNIKTSVGGVAFNICKQLVLAGLTEVELLTVLGNDTKGRVIKDTCRELGIITDNIHVCHNSETDSYLAIEDAQGLKAAIAQVKNVEKFSDKILKPLENGAVKTKLEFSKNLIILDGNLSPIKLSKIAKNKNFMNYDVRIVSASPAKAIRLQPFLNLSNTTIYCNKNEAEILCKLVFKNTKEASSHLLKKGLGRAIVTDGANPICDSTINQKPILILPPKVKYIRHVSGAGDYFLACHIANEINQLKKENALAQAAKSAAKYVETEIK